MCELVNDEDKGPGEGGEQKKNQGDITTSEVLCGLGILMMMNMRRPLHRRAIYEISRKKRPKKKNRVTEAEAE